MRLNTGLAVVLSLVLCACGGGGGGASSTGGGGVSNVTVPTQLAVTSTGLNQITFATESSAQAGKR